MLYISRITESGNITNHDVMGADFSIHNPDLKDKVKEINQHLITVGYHIEDIPDGRVVIANSNVKRDRIITDLTSAR